MEVFGTAWSDNLVKDNEEDDQIKARTKKYVDYVFPIDDQEGVMNNSESIPDQELDDPLEYDRPEIDDEEKDKADQLTWDEAIKVIVAARQTTLPGCALFDTWIDDDQLWVVAKCSDSLFDPVITMGEFVDKVIGRNAHEHYIHVSRVEMYAATAYPVDPKTAPVPKPAPDKTKIRMKKFIYGEAYNNTDTGEVVVDK